MDRRILLVAAIMGLLALGVQATVTATKPIPPKKAPIKNVPLKKNTGPCEAPLKACDFFFNNFKDTTPVIKLNAVSSEKVASTALRHQSGKPVTTATTSGAFCQVIGKGGSCENYFFFRARGGIDAYTKLVNRNDRLGIRPMPEAKIEALNGKCIKLFIETAKIKLGKGVNASEWLNPNDNKTGYPQNRRCVVFKTVSGKNSLNSGPKPSLA